MELKESYHGIDLSLSSIRNQRSSGIGEYLDLIPLITWVKKTGFDIVQLLPINDSGGDSSPYAALSAKALHPINISLWALPFFELLPLAEESLASMRHCNSSKRFCYPAVLDAKDTFLREYFDSCFVRIEALPSYQEFIRNNSWLTEYALFKALKEKNHGVAWWDWPEDEKNPSVESFQRFRDLYAEEINFHSMTQFFAFDQMRQVREAAREAQVLIKGDIPILINRDSADVWGHREGFIIDLAAGAPPDMYSKEGQYWGFPLFNWKQHEETHFTWWRERLQVAERLYDLYRIDHIVGFFRIWAIPPGKKAKEGYFVPQDEREWIPQGKKILQMMLETSSMLPIGEDLGVVPDAVRELMASLGIAGTKVMRWERRWKGDRSYIPLSEYPKESMTTVSTHDSDTLVAWWDRADEDALTFAQNFHIAYESPLPENKHEALLHLSHMTTSRFHINLLQEYLALFPDLCWEDPEDERINIPGLVLDSNWTYRFRPMLDAITSHESLLHAMRRFSGTPRHPT